MALSEPVEHCVSVGERVCGSPPHRPQSQYHQATCLQRPSVKRLWHTHLSTRARRLAMNAPTRHARKRLPTGRMLAGCAAHGPKRPHAFARTASCIRYASCTISLRWSKCEKDTLAALWPPAPADSTTTWTMSSITCVRKSQRRKRGSDTLPCTTVRCELCWVVAAAATNRRTVPSPGGADVCLQHPPRRSDGSVGCRRGAMRRTSP